MMRLLCGGFLNKKALLFLRQKCHEEVGTSEEIIPRRFIC